METTIDVIAEKLLSPCWRGIDANYKRKYARNIWQQFEDNIRSAAYTSGLAKFLEALTLRLAIVIRAADARSVHEAIAGLDERAALRLLRQETIALVLTVRVANELRQDERRQKQQAQEEITGPNDSIFDLDGESR